MFNQVILIGRLIKDAEVREIANGKLVANATLVTNKKFKNKDGEIEEKSEFHNRLSGTELQLFPPIPKRVH